MTRSDAPKTETVYHSPWARAIHRRVCAFIHKHIHRQPSLSGQQQFFGVFDQLFDLDEKLHGFTSVN